MSNHHVIGIVPAYKPEPKLADLLKQCVEGNFLNHILVVDDGSGPDYAPLFDQIARIENVSVLHLGVNSGMGGAIKMGIQHAVWKWPETAGFIAFDADGQHLPEDIRKIVEEFQNCPSEVVLGVRDFHDPSIDIPLRSRFGNRVTETIFYLLTGKHITDTQTGLRCYPAAIAKECVGIYHNRYEFQLEALLLCVQQSGIRQVPIRTVYEDGNKCSHFNPIRDSIRIYLVLFRFAAASLICSLVDYVVFALLFLLLGAILPSLIISRICSVSLNFVINRSKVFHSGGKWGVQACQFALLALLLFCGSWFGMSYLKNAWGWNPLISKIVVEILLFIASFLFQRLWIFSSGKKDEKILTDGEK